MDTNPKNRSPQAQEALQTVSADKLRSTQEHLRKLSTGEILPGRLSMGLCWEFDNVLGVPLHILYYSYIYTPCIDLTKWEHYTGEDAYVIEHPSLNPRDAFWKSANGWQPCGDGIHPPAGVSAADNDEYIRRRLELCALIADGLEPLCLELEELEATS